MIPPSEEKKLEESQDIKNPEIEPKNHSKALWIFTALLVLAGLIWFCLWFFHFRYYQSTDDAYVQGNLININSAIPGNVVAFFADDTDLVEEGQLLVLLDGTKYNVAYEKELKTLASTVLEVRQLYDDVSIAKMNVEIKKTALSKIRYDHKNRAELVNSDAISGEEFEHSKDDLTTAEYQMKQAQDELKRAINAAGNTALINHPRIDAQKNNVREAFYNLKHTKIFSPARGYVAQRNVNVGEWVQPGTHIMAVIPADNMWVDANFKETQLKYMRIGQPADVWLDIYGSKVKYKGKVIGIASGTGSVFSLIPPQNATGNWIKIVQRLPVRISLDPETVEKFPGRLGLSAQAHVNITDQDLPMLATIPASAPVAATDVYNLDWENVNHTIEKVIEETLRT